MNPEWGKGFILSCGTHRRVSEPAWLKDVVKQEAADIVAKSPLFRDSSGTAEAPPLHLASGILVFPLFSAVDDLVLPVLLHLIVVLPHNLRGLCVDEPERQAVVYLALAA